jgi:membrane-bound ClpP family serine protease
MIKLKAWHNIGLKSTIDSKVGVIGENDVKPGDEGTTVSKLAPMGKAIINGKIFEVSSFGNYIETNVNVIVTSVERNKIYVEIKN